MCLSGENKHRVSAMFRFVKLAISTVHSRYMTVFSIKFNKNKKKYFIKRIYGYSIGKLMFHIPIFSTCTLVAFISLGGGSRSEEIDTLKYS